MNYLVNDPRAAAERIAALEAQVERLTKERNVALGLVLADDAALAEVEALEARAAQLTEAGLADQARADAWRDRFQAQKRIAKKLLARVAELEAVRDAAQQLASAHHYARDGAYELLLDALAAVGKGKGWQTLARAQPEAGTMCQVRAANGAGFDAAYNVLSDDRRLWAVPSGPWMFTNPKDEWQAVDAEKGNDDE